MFRQGEMPEEKNYIQMPIVYNEDYGLQIEGFSNQDLYIRQRRCYQLKLFASTLLCILLLTCIVLCIYFYFLDDYTATHECRELDYWREDGNCIPITKNTTELASQIKIKNKYLLFCPRANWMGNIFYNYTMSVYRICYKDNQKPCNLILGENLSMFWLKFVVKEKVVIGQIFDKKNPKTKSSIYDASSLDSKYKYSKIIYCDYERFKKCVIVCFFIYVVLCCICTCFIKE